MPSVATVHRPSGPPFVTVCHFDVRLPGLCTDALNGVVGQHEMGQSPQVQVVKDGLIVQGSLSTTSR